MEFGRFAQIDRLKAAGWIEDDECQRFYNHDPDVIGGPTYMRSPDGRIHEVSCDRETPVDGSYRLIKGSTKSTNYRDGRARFAQG